MRDNKKLEDAREKAHTRLLSLIYGRNKLTSAQRHRIMVAVHSYRDAWLKLDRSRR